MTKAQELFEIEGPNAHWTLVDYEKELASPDSRLFEWQESRGKVSGFVLYREFPDFIEVLNLAVRTRGQGWGRRLLQAFFQDLLHKKLDQKTEGIRLEVARANFAAVALYKKHGFEQVGLRKGYYSNGDDALLMTRLWKKFKS